MHNRKDYSIKGKNCLYIKEIEFIEMHNNRYNEDGTVSENKIFNWRFYNGYTDENAEMFDIEIVEFRNMLVKYNAQRIYINDYYPDELGFESIEDCVKFINSEELMPYLVMKKLGD